MRLPEGPSGSSISITSGACLACLRASSASDDRAVSTIKPWLRHDREYRRWWRHQDACCWHSAPPRSWGWQNDIPAWPEYWGQAQQRYHPCRSPVAATPRRAGNGAFGFTPVAADTAMDDRWFFRMHPAVRLESIPARAVHDWRMSCPVPGL